MQGYVFWCVSRRGFSLVVYADWTPVQVHPRVVQLVSRVSTRIFVGNGMERNEDWMDISSNVSTARLNQCLI